MALVGVRELLWATKKNTQENTTMSCVWYTFWVESDIFWSPWGNQIDCFWSSTRQARPWLCQGPLLEAKSLSEGSRKRTKMWLLFGSLFWSLSETSVVGMWCQNGVLKNTPNWPFWDTSDLAKVLWIIAKSHFWCPWKVSFCGMRFGDPAKPHFLQIFTFVGVQVGPKNQSEKRPKFGRPELIMEESGLRSHGPKMTPNPRCRVIHMGSC